MRVKYRRPPVVNVFIDSVEEESPNAIVYVRNSRLEDLDVDALVLVLLFRVYESFVENRITLYQIDVCAIRGVISQRSVCLLCCF